jgi:fructose-1,6-bisphosphatase II
VSSELLRPLPSPGVLGAAGPGLLRATEQAATAAARLSGRGDPELVRTKAAAAMLEALEWLGVSGRVALGARGDSVLSQDAVVGAIGPPRVDLGVYPVEGASLVERGLPNAISVLVAVEPDTFPSLPGVGYMDKIVAGPEARGALELEDTVADNLRRIAFARNVRVSDLVVAVLDRPRHQELIEEVRSTGARLLVLGEGEIAGAIMAASDGTGVDAMVGIGGLPETIIAAALVRCLGGELQARLWPRNEEERLLAGTEVDRIYGVSDLAPEFVSAAVTGISGGHLLQAVWFGSAWVETSSLAMATQPPTIRRVTSRHLRVGETG